MVPPSCAAGDLGGVVQPPMVRADGRVGQTELVVSLGQHVFIETYLSANL